MDIKSTALFVYLKSQNNEYASKVQEVENEIEKWLSYIPQTFPHYTSHTIGHSKEIVLQMSKILFKNENPDKCVVDLSAVEAYILIIAAYLHDAGMVVSDNEKEIILKSKEWKLWLESNADQSNRFSNLEKMREVGKQEQSIIKNFQADRQLRFLIAEYIRTDHHNRSKRIIEKNDYSLGRFSFGDNLLVNTISTVCESHGIERRELDDRTRFPEERDVRGEKVNIKFLSIILRLADLLDLDSNRACPMIQSAASPLPPESLAHWQQFECITHKSVTHDKIVFNAECNTQEEDRLLRDWFQWIVDEVNNATILMIRSRRHSDWKPPKASISSESGESTITIIPSPQANYTVLDWRFKLDQDIIFERLIYDLYDRPEVFIRELIQNSLDAMRCKIYSDIDVEGKSRPEYPTQIDQEILERYPLQLTMETREEKDDESDNSPQKNTYFIIEDSGIGMSRNVIQDYFLQIGRSYYQTEEFRRTYQFYPSSQFGIGFLSVFAVSDFVRVETYNPEHDESTKIELRGFRNYLLVENSDRRIPGTKIEVRLRQPLKSFSLLNHIKELCPMVEFPIVIKENDVEEIVKSEIHREVTYKIPVVGTKNHFLTLKYYPILKAGLEGYLFVFVYTEGKEQHFDRTGWAKYNYPESHPLAIQPYFPDSIICVNGIQLDKENGIYAMPMGARVDVRMKIDINLNRLRTKSTLNGLINHKLLLSSWSEILSTHLKESKQANMKNGWIYRQKLVKDFNLFDFWKKEKNMVRVYKQGNPYIYSLDEVASDDKITVIFKSYSSSILRYLPLYQEPRKPWKAFSELESTVLVDWDLKQLSQIFLQEIFKSRIPENLEKVSNNFFSLDWVNSRSEIKIYGKAQGHDIAGCDFPSPEYLGIRSHLVFNDYFKIILLNQKNLLVQWALRVLRYRSVEGEALYQPKSKYIIETIGSILASDFKQEGQIQNLNIYLNEWDAIPGLPKELKYPGLIITSSMFNPDPKHLKII